MSGKRQCCVWTRDSAVSGREISVHKRDLCAQERSLCAREISVRERDLCAPERSLCAREISVRKRDLCARERNKTVLNQILDELIKKVPRLKHFPPENYPAQAKLKVAENLFNQGKGL